VNDSGAVPVQVPFVVVSVPPSIAEPEIAGATVLAGPDGAMVALAAELAAREPAAFVAVTRSRIVAPTSAPVRT